MTTLIRITCWTNNMRLDPVQLRRNSGVDSRSIGSSTASTPGDDTNQDVLTIFTVNQRSSAVSPARILLMFSGTDVVGCYLGWFVFSMWSNTLFIGHGDYSDLDRKTEHCPDSETSQKFTFCNTSGTLPSYFSKPHPLAVARTFSYLFIFEFGKHTGIT